MCESGTQESFFVTVICESVTVSETLTEVLIATDDTGSLIKSVSDGINIADSFETFHKGVYDTLRNGKSDQKAEFALDLIYAVDPNELIVPAYIDEGLKWLQAYLDPEE